MNRKSTFTKAGLRTTPGRLKVLEVLQGSKVPLSADHLWRRLSEVSLATIYRTLSALCGAGLVRKILHEDKTLYESIPSNTGPQLVCSRCGKVENIKDPMMLRYNASILKRRGLTAKNSVLLYADCQRKRCLDL